MSGRLHPSSAPHCRLSHCTSLWAGQLSPTMLSACCWHLLSGRHSDQRRQSPTLIPPTAPPYGLDYFCHNCKSAGAQQLDLDQRTLRT
ncbi:hypothetical protein ABVT39_023177 [Epinephelus coioides]